MSGQPVYTHDPSIDTQYVFGSAEYSERMIKPTANVGFFGWLALLGIPFFLLFLIYNKSTESGLVTATNAQRLHNPAPAIQQVEEPHP
jgi:hypothetical protein